MVADWLHALLALAALFVPLGFAWLALSRTARRHPHRAPSRDDASMPTRTGPRSPKPGRPGRPK